MAEGTPGEPASACGPHDLSVCDTDRAHPARPLRRGAQPLCGPASTAVRRPRGRPPHIGPPSTPWAREWFKDNPLQRPGRAPPTGERASRADDRRGLPTVAGCLVECGVRPARIRMIPTAIDVDRFRFDPASRLLARRAGDRSEGPVIGTAGRLVPASSRTGCSRRCANCTSVVLLVVGDGPERERLGELARRWQMSERVVFTGDCLDMGAMYSAMDVFVRPRCTRRSAWPCWRRWPTACPRCTCTTPVWTSWPTDPYRGVPGRSWGRVAACGDRPAEGRAAPSRRRGAGGLHIRPDRGRDRLPVRVAARPAPRRGRHHTKPREVGV